MASRKRTLPGFKACTKCRYITVEKAEQCPNCGATSFTETWRGMVIIVDVEKSCIARLIGAERPGMYAIELEGVEEQEGAY